MARTRPKRWLLALLAWATFILIATSIPNPQSPIPPTPGADKAAHVLLYLPLAWLAIRWRQALAAERPVAKQASLEGPGTGVGESRPDGDDRNSPSVASASSNERRMTATGSEILLVAAVLFLFAAADEFHQSFIPGRSCDPLDWAADASAILLGIPAALYRGRSPRPDR